MKKNTKQPKNATQLGWFVSKITKSFYNKQGFAQNHIMENWETIVGSKFSKNSMPIKLNIKKNGGTLIIACDGAVALELEYLKSEIINKVNSYYNFKAINKIKFKNLPLEIKTDDKKYKITIENDKKSFYSMINNEMSPLEDASPIEKALLKLENSVLKRKNKL